MKPTTQPFGQSGILLRAQLAFAVLGGLYLIALGLLTVPFFQTHVVYLHAIPNPLFPNFDIPEKYGLAPGKTFNLRIQTADNVSIGAWFVLSDSVYHTISVSNTPRDAHIHTALQMRPTILYFHGNAASRAAPFRVRKYSEFSSRLGANVLVIDYRGFGDSTGKPSKDGLASDARAAWDWLIEMGAKPEDVLIIGHSLGTAVGGRLAAELGREDIPIRGLVLLSPFSSLRTLLDTYSIFGVFPIKAPLAIIPGSSHYITWSLTHTFDTLKLMPDIKASILIAHADNDWEIPISHSAALFDAVVDREKVVRTNIKNFGTVDETEKAGRKVKLLKTLDGGHNMVGALEGVQELVRTTFDFTITS